MATTYYGETDRTRGVLTYSTSQTDTQVTVTARTQLQAKSYGYSGYRLNTKFDGTTVSTKLSYVPGIYTSWTTAIDTGDYSKTYTRTHSAQSLVIKSEYYGEGTGDYYAGGKSGDTSVTVTIPAKASYSITYNANGGSGAPSSQTKWHGETLTLSSTVPTRTNYIFLGWSTSSTATSATYSAGGSYTANAAATLYAVWQLNGYTIQYNLNGGSGSFANQTKIHGQTLTLRTGSPTKASASAGNYTVTYNANSGSVSPTSATAARTTSYTFSKWNTAANGTGTNYNSGGSYTANAAATLYAQYTSSTSTASVTLPTPTRTGYTCSGWYTAASGGTKVGNTGASYTPTGNVTIYAQWTALTYTIQYNLNGGSGSFANQTKTYGQKLTLRTGSPTKANSSAGSFTITYNANGGSVSPSSATSSRTTSYAFSKWNTASNGSGTNYNPGGSYTANAAATLYAQYTETTTAAALTLPTPTRSGYTFAGWYTAQSGGTKIGNAGANYTPTGTATIYAHWSGNTYTVSYSAPGATNVPSSQTKTQDVALTLSTTKPSKTDYTFKGWDTNSAATTVVYSPGASFTTNANTILYGVFTLNYVEPKITNVTAVRCDSSGSSSDDGTYVKVGCSWSTFSTNYKATKLEIFYKLTTASSWTTGYTNNNPNASSGTISQVIGGGNINTEYTYNVMIRVTDSVGNGSYTTYVSSAFYAIDQGTAGKSLGFGVAASDTDIPANGRLDIGMDVRFTGKFPMVDTSYGGASAGAAIKFSDGSGATSPFTPAFMLPSKVGSWALATYPGSGELFYFVYNNGSGTSNTNTKRYYLDPSKGNADTTNRIFTTAETIGIGNGGTGATTANAGANNLLAGLPAWTANPTDDTYFIRQDTAGTNTFGRVKASTIYNYIGGKIGSTYLPLAGGTMTGTINLAATGLKTSNTAGWVTDQYGSLKHQRTTDTDTFSILNNAGSVKFKVNYETGDVVAQGDLYGEWLHTTNTMLNGSGISFHFSDKSSATYAMMFTSREANYGGRLVFREWSENSSGERLNYYENFRLPRTDQGRTTNATYDILTTKGVSMTGYFMLQNATWNPYLRFKPSQSTNNGDNTFGPASIRIGAGHGTEVRTNQMVFRLYSPTASSGSTTYTAHYEDFELPSANIGRTTDGAYGILTTKHTVSIAQGGTGATTRLDALKALTSESVGTSAQFFLTITNSWGKGGYTNISDAKTVLGITGTQYGSNHMGWKKVSITLTNGAGSVACTGVTADSVVQATRVGTYSDTSGGYSTHIGAAASNAGNIKVFSTATGTVTWNVYLWWSKTATGG